MEAAAAAQAALVERLLDPGCYNHPVRGVHRVETHISHVLLTGEFAYKIKKPLDLGFLNFTTLEARRFYCEEEVRLNRRLAPGVYLGVVPVAGTPERPRMNGAGPALDYAVKMRQFPEDMLLDRVEARGELTARHIAAMAREIAAFHGGCARAQQGMAFGSPEHIRRPMEQNFEQIGPLLADAQDISRLEQLRRWSAESFTRLRPLLEERRRAGFVRECHGDLHLGNLFLEGEEIRVFDCIEFNPDFRWIDVMSEVAFLVMDLYHRDHPDLARRFLNAYLELGGDYEGVELLRFYLVYRALVRAKIAAIRAGQEGVGEAERGRDWEEYRRHVRLAGHFSEPEPPLVLITHGLSGSGKTVLSGELLARLNAVRLRSDVERKRLFGWGSTARSGSALNVDWYTPEATRKTYAAMVRAARPILAGGWSLLVDASFLKRWQRELFRALAREMGAPFAILDLRTDAATLRTRVASRERTQQDASEATVEVLEAQMKSREPLAAEELASVIAVDGERATDAAVIEVVVADLRKR